MSVVHQLSPGWLLDHLSFINKINYRVHQPQEPCCRKNESTSVGFDSPRMDSKSSFGSSATFVVSDSTTKPGNKDGGNCGMFTQKYAFRSELFHVTKPYITAAVHGEGQQRSEREDAANGVKKETATSITGKRWNSGPCTCEAGTGTTELNPEAQKLDIFETFPAIKRKKRKKCVVFNQGELDAMEYHTKIREQILDGSLRLIQEGLKSGFLYQLFEKQDQRSEPTSLPPDACSLPGLCELAKRSQALGEVELPTLRLREEDLSVAEQDLLSRVVENDSSFSKMITLMGQKYLLPPKSSFLLSDISCMQPLLNCRKTFDAIVIDPPWQNKSVKRSNRYSYLSPLQIQQVPIPQLAAPDCLVVTWVTNRQKHLRFVKDELYPSWSVAALAEWHWVKITKTGEFVFPLDSPHKKPYEGLILGRVQEKNTLPLRSTDAEVPPIPDHKLIVSVPCAVHSHKPPLAEVLKDYIKPGGECLELFARNLQPGWTSWGNEVLKFQHMDYFVALESGC